MTQTKNLGKMRARHLAPQIGDTPSLISGLGLINEVSPMYARVISTVDLVQIRSGNCACAAGEESAAACVARDPAVAH